MRSPRIHKRNAAMLFCFSHRPGREGVAREEMLAGFQQALCATVEQPVCSKTKRLGTIRRQRDGNGVVEQAKEGLQPRVFRRDASRPSPGSKCVEIKQAMILQRAGEVVVATTRETRHSKTRRRLRKFHMQPLRPDTAARAPWRKPGVQNDRALEVVACGNDLHTPYIFHSYPP